MLSLYRTEHIYTLLNVGKVKKLPIGKNLLHIAVCNLSLMGMGFTMYTH